MSWGRLGFCGSAIHGGAETRQQGGPEKSKPAGFVADGQFQPKCLGSEFSRQIAVDL